MPSNRGYVFLSGSEYPSGGWGLGVTGASFYIFILLFFSRMALRKLLPVPHLLFVHMASCVRITQVPYVRILLKH